MEAVAQCDLLRLLVQGSLPTEEVHGLMGEVQTEWWYVYGRTANGGFQLDMLTPGAIVFQSAREYWEIYGSLPTANVLRSMVNNRTDVQPLPKHQAAQFLETALGRDPQPSTTTYLVSQLKTHYLRRVLQETGVAAIQAAETGDPLETVNMVFSRMMEAQNSALGRSGQSCRPMYGDELMLKALEGKYNAGRIPYPYASFNKQYGGLRRGEIVVVAGKGNAGKSFITHDIAIYAAEQGYKVLCVELEMSEATVSLRLLASMTGIPMTAIELGTLSAEEVTALEHAKALLQSDEAHNHLARRMMFLNSTNGNTVEKIERELRAAAFSPDLILIDYITLMSPGGKNRSMQEHEKLQIIIPELRNLIQSYNSALLTPMHLNAAGGLQFKNVFERADLVLKAEAHEQFGPVDPDPTSGSWRGLPGVVVVQGLRNRTGVYKSTRYLLGDWSTATIKDLPYFNPETYAQTFA